LDQIHTEKIENLKNTAIAVRSANSDDFEKFLKELDSLHKQKKKQDNIDHKANLAKLNTTL